MWEIIVTIVIFTLIILICCFFTRVEKISTNKQQKKIAGVCAGLSQSSGMPVWIARVFFLVSVLFFGFGIVFYLSLWLSMLKAPEEPGSKIPANGDGK